MRHLYPGQYENLKFQHLSQFLVAEPLPCRIIINSAQLGFIHVNGIPILVFSMNFIPLLKMAFL
jgi:hypothetical protein